MTDEEKGLQKVEQPMKLDIKDEIFGAEYANALQTQFTPLEIILTFISVVAPSGKAVSKVMVSPAHLKRIIPALVSTLQQYEQKYGVTQEANDPIEGEVEIIPLLP